MPTNKASIAVIVTTIAVMAFICVGTICYLSFKGIQIPPELNTLTATLTGALGGMLVKTTPTETTKQPLPPGGGGGPSEVHVINKPDDPVPTTETT